MSGLLGIIFFIIFLRGAVPCPRTRNSKAVLASDLFELWHPWVWGITRPTKGEAGDVWMTDGGIISRDYWLYNLILVV